MTINIKKIAADIVVIGVAISAILAILLNVSHSINMPASDVAILVTASSVVGAIVNAIKPLAASTVAKAAKALGVHK